MKKRQRQIYDYIDRYVASNQYPPSMKEITEAVGLCSTSTVKGHLDNMQRAGYLEFEPSKPRTIRLLK